MNFEKIFLHLERFTKIPDRFFPMILRLFYRQFSLALSSRARGCLNVN